MKTVVIERYTERLEAPKAHALSPRSLEICRQFYLDVQHLRQIGTKRADAFWVNFLTSLSGESVGVLPYERMDADVLDYTPEVRYSRKFPTFTDCVQMIHNIPQPKFEQFLSQQLCGDPNVTIRKGVSFVSLSQVCSRSP